MIAMPRRTVTRFFIPLIDVLLLLFCAFLLMPMVNEEELDKNIQSATDLTEVVSSLERELERRNQDVGKLEDPRPEPGDLEKLRAEVERLRKERKDITQRIAFKIIDIDSADGSLTYAEPTGLDQERRRITDETMAHQLIEEHKRQAKGQELYYYFLYPRVESGYPTRHQAKEYGAWFIQVPNSLKRREVVP
jgi:hypothetical protein